MIHLEHATQIQIFKWNLRPECLIQAFVTTVVRSPSSLWKGTITVVGQRADASAITADRNNRQVIFKNCLPFTYCISETNNIQVDNAKDVDVVMPMYNLIEYNSKYVKASETLC